MTFEQKIKWKLISSPGPRNGTILWSTPQWYTNEGVWNPGFNTNTQYSQSQQYWRISGVSEVFQHVLVMTVEQPEVWRDLFLIIFSLHYLWKRPVLYSSSKWYILKTCSFVEYLQISFSGTVERMWLFYTNVITVWVIFTIKNFYNVFALLALVNRHYTQ